MSDEIEELADESRRLYKAIYGKDQRVGDQLWKGRAEKIEEREQINEQLKKLKRIQQQHEKQTPKPKRKRVTPIKVHSTSSTSSTRETEHRTEKIHKHMQSHTITQPDGSSETITVEKSVNVSEVIIQRQIEERKNHLDILYKQTESKTAKQRLLGSTVGAKFLEYVNTMDYPPDSPMIPNNIIDMPSRMPDLLNVALLGGKYVTWENIIKFEKLVIEEDGINKFPDDELFYAFLSKQIWAIMYSKLPSHLMTFPGLVYLADCESDFTFDFHSFTPFEDSVLGVFQMRITSKALSFSRIIKFDNIDGATISALEIIPDVHSIILEQMGEFHVEELSNYSKHLSNTPRERHNQDFLLQLLTDLTI